ncbi:probable chitinase 2 [Neocloeon triangulifer]|uniref:probable chitinase 2 n=1 Tax=Neocloeon triangulifer TaxID=2078957 RepID=UPI00286F8F4D|nr:probable chitinase 2 [Neocloeon triangulifer]
MRILFAISVLPHIIRAFAVNQDLSGEGQVGGHGRTVVCYVSSWAAYRPENGNFSLTDLDPTICTHFVYAFAGLNAVTNEIRSLDPYRDLTEDYGLGWYRRLTLMKKNYPHLKVTLAVGGWNEGSQNYSIMASDPAKRASFISSAVKILNEHNFDGLDLDWEFPSDRGGKPEDKANFVTLVKELREAMPNKILTSAFGASKRIIDAAYDIPTLARYLDHMHIMAYDYHGAWDRMTGPNAPLFTSDSHDPLSIAATIKHLKSLGAPSKKLVLGVPMYGRTFLLSDPSNKQANDFGLPTQERGFKGPYTREDGFMGYNEICKEIESLGSPWSQKWDETSKTVTAVNGDKWITYDNKKSVAKKATYAIEEDLGGVMVWSIDTDDFRGDCSGDGGSGQEQRVYYPLVRAMNAAMTNALKHKNENQHIEETTSSGSASIQSAIFSTIFILSRIF